MAMDWILEDLWWEGWGGQFPGVPKVLLIFPLIWLCGEHFLIL